jgi:hypothetical protein
MRSWDVPKARKEQGASLLFSDGHILKLRVGEVPEPVPPSAHCFKYSCFYGRPGERMVLYDNERGRGPSALRGAGGAL